MVCPSLDKEQPLKPGAQDRSKLRWAEPFPTPKQLRGVMRDEGLERNEG